MAAGRLILPGMMPAEDGNGVRLAGAKLFFYDSGTTTLKAVYTSSSLTTQLANPVIANDVGVFPPIWADTAQFFTVVATEEDNTPIPGASWDGVSSSIDATLASVALSEAAQVAAEAAADSAASSAAAAAASAEQAEELVDGFGDLAGAIAAAQAAQAAAETAETNAEAAETNAEAAQAAAEAAAAQALAVIGFDPTKVIRVDTSQSFTSGERNQARSNIAAAPTSAPSFTGGASIAGGLTVSTGGLAVSAGGLSLVGGASVTGSSKSVPQAVSGTDIDLSASDFFTKSISSNTTFTFSNATAARAQVFLLELTITSSATPTWPASVDHPSGNNPSASLGVGRHILGFITFNGGTDWVMIVLARNVS